PALAVTSHVEEADDLLQCIPLGTPLGLDAEWKVNFGSGVISKTALLQICSPTLIVIIQCRRMKNLPRRLVELLQDPGTIKTGVAVVADCRRLQRDFKVTAQGILELGSLAKSVDAERWSSNNGLIGLSTLCRIYLDRRLVKGPVRTSDWEGPLSKQQIDYAASDAFVALEILGKLCSLTSQS
ncbi:ribonuclease H-like protein, partial [Microstroma glucosiphilum]